ncbi:MAG: type II secretion system F family protein [Nitrospirae bacterium]|nr:type II secretion system F family protein [Nitrospirota bacterium]
MASTYKWTGRTVRGAVQSGEISAASREEATTLLRRQGVIPTELKLKDDKPFGGLFAMGGKVKDKDIVVFTRQFATMIDAGLPLVQALEILSKQTESPALAAVIGKVKSDVEAGATYADALKKHPRVFDDLYSNMVAAGEAGGILDTILNRLAGYIEKSMKLKKKVKGALTYPAVIVTVAGSVISVIMIYVIPIFASMFSNMGGVLPAPTRAVMAMSSFLAGPGGLSLLVGIFGTITGIKQARKTDKGKFIFDTIALKMPIFGMLIRKVAVAKFTRTLGTLVSSGVPILDGLDICAKTSGNKVVERGVQEVRKAVAEGKTIAEPLMKTGVFPPMVNQMISVGEATGALDAMLSKIADFYDDEVDNAVANMTAMMEPLLMVFLGGSVGFIVVAMYLPIFRMITLIK